MEKAVARHEGLLTAQPVTPAQIVENAAAEPAEKSDVLDLVRAQNKRNKDYLVESGKVLNELERKRVEHKKFEKDIKKLNDDYSALTARVKTLEDNKPIRVKRRSFFGG